MTFPSVSLEGNELVIRMDSVYLKSLLLGLAQEFLVRFKQGRLWSEVRWFIPHELTNIRNDGAFDDCLAKGFILYQLTGFLVKHPYFCQLNLFEKDLIARELIDMQFLLDQIDNLAGFPVRSYTGVRFDEFVVDWKTFGVEA